MKLKTLIQGLPVQIKGSKEASITGLSSDSRKTAPGNLFIAKDRLHGADKPRRAPDSIEEVFYQISRRRLPIRSGNPEEEQLL